MENSPRHYEADPQLNDLTAETILSTAAAAAPETLGRRLLAEYARTGEVSDELRQELLEYERAFERDPQLRDRVKREIQAAGGSTPLSTLLQQAGVTEQDDTPESKSEAERSRERLSRPKQPLLGTPSRRRWLDIAFITVIAILLLLVIILLMNRG